MSDADDDPTKTDPDAEKPGTPDAEKPDAHSDVTLSRRTLLLGGGLAGLGMLAAGTALGRGWAALGPASSASAPAPTPTKSPGPPLRTFVSTPVTTPATTSWRHGRTAHGLLFVTPQTEGFNGVVMHDSGDPVWIEPTKMNMTDLRVQAYQGHPVLTYWSGKSIGGHGQGTGTILDDSYTPIATVHAAHGLHADLHEFNLTTAGTALITAYTTIPADLSPVGGRAHGYIYNCHVQEIDIATGEALLDWNVHDAVPVADTYLGLHEDPGHDGVSAARAFDPYHLNAIAVRDATTLLVSLRHTHTIYAIDRTTGAVRWRMGGRHSDFRIPADATFAWQHDIRSQPDGTVTMFDNNKYRDNHDGKADDQSSGLHLSLDESARTVSLVHRYTYDRHLGTAMGSLQMLPGGNALIGWGTAPYVTEFDAQGHPIYEATLGGISYRAARCAWAATPRTAPDIAARPDSGAVRVFLSWNGATEVERWRISAGPTAATLQHTATSPRSGFETAVLIPRAKVVRAEAIDRTGAVLGQTATINV